MSWRLAAGVLCLLLAPAAPAQGDDPAQLMAQLEARVLAAKRVSIEATIESRGLVASSLKGRTELLERNRATLAYAGEFAGKAADLGLAADGRGVDLKNGATGRREPVGREANRALLIGLLRMGQLHNLARLTGLQAPDHAAGGVDQWVTLDSFRPTTFAQGTELEGTLSFGFDIVVGGEVSGSARLWLNTASGLPRRRSVTVHFPQGEMSVVEEYTSFVVD
jgi:hypothetical protein